ncbi:hypothetical protein CVT24_002905 [Panaeolus cyanescens]|uniref:Cation/H+ exchanger transmembrane domain-containing protein n=1 Tax=Panaeolus cyanescens TaxID=181874 RepID=A0A409W8L3_9AGAR|nr:hypothetical protein CVT24_002905 [Panaeolus cyanescens]
MGELSRQIIEVVARAASEQGGVISGDNPTKYSPSNPIRLWIIQVIIIIAFTQILSLGLSRIRQPRVIAEVIGGIILGPTVMGRIPGFKQTIFPDESMPLLVITSNVGLILFLFIVGLEIDTRVLKRNILVSANVSLAGLIVPLGLGAALGVGVYREYIGDTVNYGHFLLFTAVAISITAFPVLCRIITELKLLETDVGLVTLAAGICDDVVGWILLALTVALVNASNSLTALYVLLATVGYTIFLLFPCRWGYRWLARRTGSLEKGTPSTFMMTLTLFVALASAFFTDIIGVHAIFGGFLAGLIIPHDNGYAVAIVEKIEDLVVILFIPIFFTLSGLRTNLGLLNTGKDWGYIIVICLIAFTSKFCACGAAAYFRGFKWREAAAIGSLMSCKGLVELIVLNIGLQAGILEPRTFSMFVVHALVLTFMTTPLVLFFYPPKYRVSHKEKPVGDEATISPARPAFDDGIKTKFTLLLDRMESLSAAMTLSQLLYAPAIDTSDVASLDEKKAAHFEASEGKAAISIDALRLMELTNRTSAVIKSHESESLLHNDPLISSYQTFGYLNDLQVSTHLSVISQEGFSDAVATHVSNTSSQMVMIPWARGTTTTLDEDHNGIVTRARNPFDAVFQKTTSEDQTTSFVYSEFIRRVFAQSPVDVALFVDRGSRSPALRAPKQHFFLPFFGGPDDRLALSFLVQICENPKVSATVVRFVKAAESAAGAAPGSGTAENPTAFQQTMAAADTIYGQHTTQTRLASDTADNILWAKFANARDPSPALSRISFRLTSSPTTLKDAISQAKIEASQTSLSLYSSKTLIVLLGRSRRMAADNLESQLKEVVGVGGSMSSAVPKTLGDVGAAFVAAGVNASLLVFQAAHSNNN